MCDFSKYGVRTDEWRLIEADLPPRPVVAVDDLDALHALQAALNKEREASSAADMGQFDGALAIQDHAVPTRDGQTIQARSYRPTTAAAEGAKAQQPLLPVYLHFHGGGFLFGSLGSEDATCARVAAGTGALVLHVNYRHTPAHAYPTAFEDAQDALAWLRARAAALGADAARVVVGGVSAGAHLASSLALGENLRRLGGAAAAGAAAGAAACPPPLAGQVLMIPCVAHVDCQEKLRARVRDPSVWSYVENEEAPMLPVAVVRMFFDLLKVENPDPRDLRLNPGNASPEEVKGLPPTTFGVAGLDPLRDEGLLYAKLLSENG